MPKGWVLHSCDTRRWDNGGDGRGWLHRSKHREWRGLWSWALVFCYQFHLVHFWNVSFAVIYLKRRHFGKWSQHFLHLPWSCLGHGWPNCLIIQLTWIDIREAVYPNDKGCRLWSSNSSSIIYQVSFCNFLSFRFLSWKMGLIIGFTSLWRAPQKTSKHGKHSINFRDMIHCGCWHAGTIFIKYLPLINL